MNKLKHSILILTLEIIITRTKCGRSINSMCVNVELHYWELELEFVSNQCLSLPNSDLSLPHWAVIVLYFRH